MPCILCNKDINGEEKTIEVYTTNNEVVTVHYECYQDYVKSMSMCGSGCGSCRGCG